MDGRRGTGNPICVEKLIVGCGYLGRRVASAWLRQGRAVAALTRSPENARQLEQLGLRAILGDVTDPSSLAGLPAAGTLLYAVGFDRTAGQERRAVSVAGPHELGASLISRIAAFPAIRIPAAASVINCTISSA